MCAQIIVPPSYVRKMFHLVGYVWNDQFKANLCNLFFCIGIIIYIYVLSSVLSNNKVQSLSRMKGRFAITSKVSEIDSRPYRDVVYSESVNSESPIPPISTKRTKNDQRKSLNIKRPQHMPMEMWSCLGTGTEMWPS